MAAVFKWMTVVHHVSKNALVATCLVKMLF